MKNLPKAVRNKAIEIANALLEEKNMEEGDCYCYSHKAMLKIWGRQSSACNPKLRKLSHVKPM